MKASARIEASAIHEHVLVEARQIRRVAARNAKRAIGHHPFGVDQVPHALLHAPFVWRIAMIRTQRADQLERLWQLRGQHRNGVIGFNQRNVALVVASGFLERGSHMAPA